MKINYIRLKNFVGVNAAMGLRDVEFNFESIDKPIIQIYGHNRCGKTVLIQQLHPFSNINLNGDERNDLSLIIPGEAGMKEIIYEVDGEVYDITHTYQPTRSGHSISSSIMHNGEELNPSGGVTIFNSLIEKILGINKYVIQLIINGTNLTSFANMSTTQRKNLLNKALGIDIYDKIHKLATNDYRYTNKLIVSLNNTKEYILSTYGSYETLCASMKQKQTEHDSLEMNISMTKSNMDKLYGEITALRDNNPQQEIMLISNQLAAYKKVVDELGSYDPDMYDKLVEEQISLNNILSTERNQRLMIKKDIDNLYEKKNNIENTLMANRRAREDYNNLLTVKEDLTNKIKNINIRMKLTASSQYYRSTIHLAQAINDTCSEIVSCLNKNHLGMFVDMVINNIDIAAFLIKEGSVINDSEKEMTVVARFKRLIEGVTGDQTDGKCEYPGCVYRKTTKTLETYFSSYQSTTDSQFTLYDLEQMDHAHKNLMAMKRLLITDVPDELKSMFSIEQIMTNLKNGNIGIDVSYITNMMEEAAKGELKNQYISQLTEIERSINSMKSIVINASDSDSAINEINSKIEELRNEDTRLTESINNHQTELDKNDERRMLLSQVKHLDVNDLNKRQYKYSQMITQLQTKQDEYNNLSNDYNIMNSRMSILNNELKTISDAYNQYVNTVAEIDKHDTMNGRYKIIAEATSSTKGKPVIAIRDTVEHALSLTNRLLDIMYDGEIELLDPEIDENSFTLPFRCGSNLSPDIRYGSQSENTLLSLALELSLVSSLSKYNVCLIDEIDAALDTDMTASYINMIVSVIHMIHCEQCFIISHHIDSDNNQYIHRLDIAAIADSLREK